MGYKENKNYSQATFPKISDQEIETILNGDEVASAKHTVELGEQVGNSIEEKDSATSTQLRVVFTSIRSIEAEWMYNAEPAEAERALRQFILMKSKLRYQAARHTKMKDLADLFVKMIDKVEKREQFQRFVDFFEAILAYHKAAGGKN